MATKLKQFRNQLQRDQGALDTYLASIKNNKRDVKRKKLESIRLDKAAEIIKQVGLKTQQEFEVHISDLVSSAIASVFPDDPYQFKVIFVERRGRTECDLMLERDGELIDPLTGAGGGVIDIAVLALRLASINMQRGKLRPLLLLDEPFKMLSVDLQNRAGRMIKELSDKMGVQIIMVSHAHEAVEFADKVFQVSIKDGESQVKEI